MSRDEFLLWKLLEDQPITFLGVGHQGFTYVGVGKDMIGNGFYSLVYINSSGVITEIYSDDTVSAKTSKPPIRERFDDWSSFNFDSFVKFLCESPERSHHPDNPSL
jgi:hypothetical protein